MSDRAYYLAESKKNLDWYYGRPVQILTMRNNNGEHFVVVPAESTLPGSVDRHGTRRKGGEVLLHVSSTFKVEYSLYTKVQEMIAGVFRIVDTGVCEVDYEKAMKVVGADAAMVVQVDEVVEREIPETAPPAKKKKPAMPTKTTPTAPKPMQVPEPALPAKKKTIAMPTTPTPTAPKPMQVPEPAPSTKKKKPTMPTTPTPTAPPVSQHVPDRPALSDVWPMIRQIAAQLENIVYQMGDDQTVMGKIARMEFADIPCGANTSDSEDEVSKNPRIGCGGDPVDKPAFSTSSGSSSSASNHVLTPSTSGIVSPTHLHCPPLTADVNLTAPVADTVTTQDLLTLVHDLQQRLAKLEAPGEKIQFPRGTGTVKPLGITRASLPPSPSPAPGTASSQERHEKEQIFPIMDPREDLLPPIAEHRGCNRATGVAAVRAVRDNIGHVNLWEEDVPNDREVVSERVNMAMAEAFQRIAQMLRGGEGVPVNSMGSGW